MAVNLRQTHFRFGVDELAESTHGWLAALDTNVSLRPDTTFLLRFTEQETGGTAASNTDAQFQYNKNGAGWNNITTSSAVAKAVAAAAFANGANCTKRLTGTGTFESSAAGCTEDGTSGGTTNDIVAGGNSETECGLQIVGANVVAGDVIQFRFTSPDWAVGYDITPQLTVIVDKTINAAVGSVIIGGAQAAISSPPPAQTINASVGSVVITGPSATITNETPGVTINAAVGVLTFSGPSASVAPGAVAIAAATGVLTLSGPFADVIPGTVSIAAAVGNLTFDGPQATISIAGTPQTINAAASLLTLNGPAASVIPGAVIVMAAISLLSISGPRASITVYGDEEPGGISGTAKLGKWRGFRMG